MNVFVTSTAFLNLQEVFTFSQKHAHCAFSGHGRGRQGPDRLRGVRGLVREAGPPEEALGRAGDRQACAWMQMMKFVWRPTCDLL